MKISCSSILLLTFAVSTVAAHVENDEGDGSVVKRSLFLSFDNALCLPLRDGCNRNSAVIKCVSGVLQPGDTCTGGDTCAKTTAGGVVCVIDNENAGKACNSNRDCESSQICIQFGDCLANACIDQVR